MKILLPFFALLFFVPFIGQARAEGTATLTGQIVCCEDCWNRADRKTVELGTRSDLDKAAACVAGGDPTLLAVTDESGATTLYRLEPGKYKRPGKDWLAFIGRRVTLTGKISLKGEVKSVRVDSLMVLLESKGGAESVAGATPELNLKDLFGADQKLAGMRGRIVVPDFWATYCGPCREEMPTLAAIQNEYATFGVQVVGAAADTLADQPKVVAYARERKLNFPVWLGATPADMTRFGVGSALPATVILDREGKIVWTKLGPVTEVELKAELDRLLKAAERVAKVEVSKAKRAVSRVPSCPL